MTPENFTFWLQGFFELTDTEELSKEQVAMVKEHLQLVFTKVTHPLCELVLGPKPPEATGGGLSDYLEHRPYYDQEEIC